jgi:hypothetical protein
MPMTLSGTRAPSGDRANSRDSVARRHPSRRDFLLKAGAAGLAGTVVGLAGTSIASGQLAGLRSATPRDLQNLTMMNPRHVRDVLIAGRNMC